MLPCLLCVHVNLCYGKCIYFSFDNSPKFPFLKEEVCEHILAVESLIMMHNDRASSMLAQGFFEIIAALVSDTLLYLK